MVAAQPEGLEEVAAAEAAAQELADYADSLLAGAGGGAAAAPAPADAEAAASAGALRLLRLRAAHRAACEAAEGARVGAADAKAELDAASLQLQNLLFEQQHYEKEIAAAASFRSAHTDAALELAPREAWAATPEGAAAVEAAAAAGGAPAERAHAETLARLQAELDSRAAALRELERSKAARDALAADVAARRGALAGLEQEAAKLRAAAARVSRLYGVEGGAAATTVDGADGGAP